MKALPDGWAFFVPMSKCDNLATLIANTTLVFPIYICIRKILTKSSALFMKTMASALSRIKTQIMAWD